MTNSTILGRTSAFGALAESIGTALQHYSNVHRGAGHNSKISTDLYERARAIVSQSLGVNDKYVVIFCTPWRLKLLLAELGPKAPVKTVLSQEVGLPLGICAVAIRRRDLPRPTALPQGGGTIRMVSPKHVNWSEAPELFEAGTPNITGAIALARERSPNKRHFSFTESRLLHVRYPILRRLHANTPLYPAPYSSLGMRWPGPWRSE